MYSHSKTVHMHVGDNGRGGYISVARFNSDSSPINNPFAGRVLNAANAPELLQQLRKLNASGLRIPTKYKKLI